MRRAALFLLFSLAGWLPGALAAEEAAPPAAPLPQASVGMPIELREVVLPGSELEALPVDDRDAPLVLRVVNTYPHGTAFRYDLECYALEPGTYDLAQALRRKDGTSTDDLPAVMVKVVSLLPAGQIVPAAIEPARTPFVGGYRAAMALITLLWIAGLVALVVIGRRRRLAAQAPPRAVSIAEQLRPLVERALAGTLDAAGEAELERTLLRYWSRRLHLAEADPVQALFQLRQHEEAGALLRQVEAWLHQPGGQRPTDLDRWLAPYRDLPADAAVAPQAALVGRDGSQPS